MTHSIFTPIRSLALSLCLAATMAPAFASATGVEPSPKKQSKDTIIIKLKNSDKLMIVTKKGPTELAGLKEYDINKILASVDSVLSNGSVQIYRVGANGQREVKDTTLTINTQRKDKKMVSINLSTDGGNNIRVTETQIIVSDTVKRKKSDTKWKPGMFHTNFYINVGLNNYLEKSSFPDGLGAPYGLRTGGSRYVALGMTRFLPFVISQKMGLNYGIEVAWNNFMFQKDNILRQIQDSSGERSSTIPIDTYLDKDVSVKKSKFVLATVKVPVSLRFRLSHKTSLDLGGYAGYRISSWTKIKYEDKGKSQKDRAYSNFNLSNFVYGVKGQLNLGDIGIFAEYGINPLFVAGKGPSTSALNTITLGISI